MDEKCFQNSHDFASRVLPTVRWQHQHWRHSTFTHSFAYFFPVSGGRPILCNVTTQHTFCLQRRSFTNQLVHAPYWILMQALYGEKFSLKITCDWFCKEGSYLLCKEKKVSTSWTWEHRISVNF